MRRRLERCPVSLRGCVVNGQNDYVRRASNNMSTPTPSRSRIGHLLMTCAQAEHQTPCYVIRTWKVPSTTTLRGSAAANTDADAEAPWLFFFASTAGILARCTRAFPPGVCWYTAQEGLCCAVAETRKKKRKEKKLTPSLFVGNLRLL